MSFRSVFFYMPCYYPFNKFRDERKVRNRTIILHLFLIQPRSLQQWGYGSLFQTQCGSASLTHPLTYWQWLLSVVEVDPHISSKAKWGVDPSHTTCSETCLLSPVTSSYFLHRCEKKCILFLNVCWLKHKQFNWKKGCQLPYIQHSFALFLKNQH